MCDFVYSYPPRESDRHEKDEDLSIQWSGGAAGALTQVSSRSPKDRIWTSAHGGIPVEISSRQARYTRRVFGSYAMVATETETEDVIITDSSVAIR